MLKKLKSKPIISNFLFLLGMLFLWQIPGTIIVIGSLFHISTSMFFQVIGVLTVLATVGVMLKLSLKRKIITFKLDFLTWKNIIIMVVSYVLIISITWVASVFLEGHTTANTVGIQQSISSIGILMMFAMMVILAPIAEELVFRASFKQLFFKQNPILGLIATSILFSSVHTSTSILSFILYATLGGVLYGVYWKTGRIECAMAVHGMNNAISFFVMFGH